MSAAVDLADPRHAPAWLRVDDAAAIAQVSSRTIRRWIVVGYVKASKPAGGRVLVQRDSLLDFIERGSPTTSAA